MQFRNGMNEAENEYMSLETGIQFDPDEDRAVQADALETNINTIVARFRSTGMAPAITGRPVFGDFSQGFDLAECMQRTRDVRESFSQLSAEVRDRFNGDPLRLAAFVQDEKNYEEGVRLGVLKERPAEATTEAPVVAPVQ